MSIIALYCHLLLSKFYQNELSSSNFPFQAGSVGAMNIDSPHQLSGTASPVAGTVSPKTADESNKHEVGTPHDPLASDSTTTSGSDGTTIQ